jgi:hypothetical protein
MYHRLNYVLSERLKLSDSGNLPFLEADLPFLNEWRFEQKVAVTGNGQVWVFIVNSADPQIEFDELFSTNSILQLPVGLLFYS